MTFRLPPYLKWRDGRPRWEPGPRLRHAFKARDLKTAEGEWLRLEAAIAAAKKLNDEVLIWRKGGNAPSAMPKVSKKAARTCDHLWEIYEKSPKYSKLADVTRRDYKSKIGIFLDAKIDGSGKTFGKMQVGALAMSDLYTWWEEICDERGHSMANGVLACVRVMMSYGVKKGWRATNPAKSLGLETVAPRVVIWTPAEVEAFVAKADDMKLFGVADGVVIGLHSGQRQGDVLHLEWLSADNRARFKQRKTGARVSVPFSPALAERIEAIKTRRRAGQVAELRLDGELVRDPSGKHYNSKSFNTDFRKVRAAVAKDQVAAGGEATILGKQYLDLRDTAITRLALAGATVVEIRAITGHSLDTVHDVLKHYLALDDRMADAAIDKLKFWMEQEGIAV